MANTSRYVKRDELPNPKKLRGAVKLAGDFPNDSYIIGVPKVVQLRTDTVGNITTGLDQLHSFSVPPKAWKNGDVFHLRIGGLFATNDNDKRIQLEVGGVATHNTGLFDQDSGRWTYDLDYARLSTTSITVSIILHWYFGTRDGAGTAGGNYLFTGETYQIGSIPDMDSNTTVLRVMGEATATDDIQQIYSRISLTRFS